MSWLTAKHRVKLYCASAALLGTCSVAMAGSDTEQLQRFKDPNQWGAPAGNLMLNRYSALKDINKDNVKDLQMVWAQSSGTLRGHEGQPLVIENVDGKPMMYIESGWPNIVQALDLSDPDHPEQVWSYNKTTGRDESAVPRACCDTVNRGMSYADGKLVFGTLDGYVIALDAATGKEDWVVKHAHPDKGETITPAPIIAERQSHDRFRRRRIRRARPLHGVRPGRRQESVGMPVDRFRQRRVPDAEHQQEASGIRHRRQGSRHPHAIRATSGKRGGGAAWGWYAYDPDLHLVYYSTGNPGLWCAVVPLRREAAVAGSVQRRLVGQQVVDDHLRAQCRYRRSGVGVSDDAVRPVGL